MNERVDKIIQDVEGAYFWLGDDCPPEISELQWHNYQHNCVRIYEHFWPQLAISRISDENFGSVSIIHVASQQRFSLSPEQTLNMSENELIAAIELWLKIVGTR